MATVRWPPLRAYNSWHIVVLVFCYNLVYSPNVAAVDGGISNGVLASRKPGACETTRKGGIETYKTHDDTTAITVRCSFHR